jgi:colanic acid biosynthesis glycosyl transferase WcaI
MNILLVNQVFFPDETAVSQHLTDFSLECAAAGHRVEVFAGKRDYERPQIKYLRRESYRGISIRRLGSTSFPKSGLGGRIINLLSFNANLMVRLLFISKYDCHCMICSTVPPMIAFVAAVAAKLKGIPFVYWIMDLQPDEAIAAGVLSQRGLAAWAVSRAGRLPLSVACLSVVLDRFMKKRLLLANAALKNIEIVAPWSAMESVQELSRDSNPFRIKHGIGSRFVVMYSGNHSICHPLDTLLACCNELRDHEQFLFTFIGNGVRTADVGTYKKSNALENIMQLPHQPREQLHLSLAAADAHIVVMGNPFVGIVHPCKIYSVLALGIPFVVICPRPSHLTDIVDEAGVGYAVGQGESGLLSRRLTEIAAMTQQQRTSFAIRARSLCGDRFNKHTASQRFLNMIEATLSQYDAAN